MCECPTNMERNAGKISFRARKQLEECFANIVTGSWSETWHDWAFWRDGVNMARGSLILNICIWNSKRFPNHLTWSNCERQFSKALDGSALGRNEINLLWMTENKKIRMKKKVKLVNYLNKLHSVCLKCNINTFNFINWGHSWIHLRGNYSSAFCSQLTWTAVELTGVKGGNL